MRGCKKLTAPGKKMLLIPEPGRGRELTLEGWLEKGNSRCTADRFTKLAQEKP